MNTKTLAISLALAAAAMLNTASAGDSLDTRIHRLAPGATVETSFDGPIPNLKGHVIRKEGPKTQRMVVWEDVRSQLLFIGRLLDRNGRDLNGLTEQKHNTFKLNLSWTSPIGTGDRPTKDRVFDHLDTLGTEHYTGHSQDSEVYVFYDFFCSYCKELSRKLSSHSDLKVKWLPVDTDLSPNSRKFGALVLDGILKQEDIGYGVNASLGAPTTESVEAVIHNTGLLLSLMENPNEVRTPLTLFKDEKGQIKIVTGANLSDSDIQSMKTKG